MSLVVGVRWSFRDKDAGSARIQLASASLLIVFGILLVTGQLVETTARLARYTGWQI